MSRDIALLVNPAAGRGRAALRAAEHAEQALRGRGLTVTRLTAAGPAEAAAAAARAVASGARALVAVGGDGSASLALQAVAGTTTPLGLVPVGSGNDLARALGLVPGDVGAAVRAIASGRTRAIDLGRAGDRWFGTVLATGFDARVNARAEALRWPRGRLRYVGATVAEVARLRAVPYRMELDGAALDVRAVLVAVGNTASYGGGMLICPGADPADGLFDVTVVADCGRAELLRVLPRVYRGGHLTHPAVTVHRAATVRLTADGVTGRADGEHLADLPLVAETVPAAVRVLVP